MMRDGNRDVPDPEGSDVKEVYAFYGLAAYMGQVVEKALVSLLSLLEADGHAITRADYDAIFSRMDLCTLGKLLRKAQQKLQLSPEAEALMIEALDRRNHLVHQFFADRAAAFVTDLGRVQMIEELRAFTGLFQRVEDQLILLSVPIMERYGMTSEQVDHMAAAMVAAFLAETNGPANG